MKNIIIGATRTGSLVSIPARYANRHGLITGATGSGKTVTLQTLAEQFSRAGAPVFIVDVKGDVSGLAVPGRGAAAPVRFLDVYGEAGAPINLTIAPPVRFLDVYGEAGAPINLTIARLGPDRPIRPAVGAFRHSSRGP